MARQNSKTMPQQLSNYRRRRKDALPASAVLTSCVIVLGCVLLLNVITSASGFHDGHAYDEDNEIEGEMLGKFCKLVDS